MRWAPVQLATNQSMTSAFFSHGVDLNQVAFFSIQAVWTGSPVGKLSIQISNQDVNPTINSPNQASNVTNWTDYTGSSTDVNGAGDFLWNAHSSGYRWVRVKWIPTSGTGTCNIEYNGKGA